MVVLLSDYTAQLVVQALHLGGVGVLLPDWPGDAGRCRVGVVSQVTTAVLLSLIRTVTDGIRVPATARSWYFTGGGCPEHYCVSHDSCGIWSDITEGKLNDEFSFQIYQGFRVHLTNCMCSISKHKSYWKSLR